MATDTITTQTKLRRAFWEQHPTASRKRIDYGTLGRTWECDTRCAFVDFVDSLHRSGVISDRLAQRATL